MTPEAVSWYKGSYDTGVKGETTWQAALAAISTDRYRDLIAKAREIRKTRGEDAYREFKKDLPAVSFCGTFDKQRSNKTILNATGFIVADLDHLPDVEATFESVTADELTWFAFRSPSGDGIKVGLRAEGIKDDGDIKRLFGPVARYYREVYGITIDPRCKDIARLTYLSADPGAYVNPSPFMFDIERWAEKPESPPTEPKSPPRIEGAGKAKYAAKVVEGCCKAIRESLPGNQHHTRLIQARLAAGYAGYLSESAVLADLEQAVRESGAKNMAAAMKTVQTAFAWGLAKPCEIKDPEPAETHGAAEGGAPPRTEQCRPVGFDDCPPPPILPETLPGILRAFPQAVAEAIQVPYELALINALGAVAVAAQRKFKVVVKPGYAESINIYALCALPPGERKSSTVEACKRPLVEWQAAKRLEMRDAIRDAESERKTMEKAIEGRRNKAASCNDETRVDLIEEIKRMERELPEVPVSPRLLVDDATPEALASLLETQDERIGMLEAEGGFFDTLAGRYSSGVPNLDLILKAWGGEPAQVDRKGRDAIFLRNPHITLVISPQPEIVQGMAAKPGFRGRGVVGRFLFLLPQSRLGGRDQDSTPVPATLAHSWSSTIFRLLDMPWATGPEGEKAAHGIGLTADALELWRRFASMVEAGLLPGGEFEFMTDWAGKFPGQAIRLAGLIHVATSPDPLAAINRETMASALGLAAILADHAKAAYGLMGSDPAQECAKAILRWLVRDQVATFTARDALRSVRGRFPTMDKVNPGLAILEERGFIFGNPSDTRSGPGRKPSAIYTVNPRTGEA